MEGDAGASRLNPFGGQERSDPGGVTEGQDRSDSGEPIQESIDPPTETVETEATQEDDHTEPAASDGVSEPLRRSEHIGRGWFVGICALVVLATAGVAVGGYLALRAHDQSAVVGRDEDVALARAKECVAATQAPDISAMTQAQTKIIECGTGDFAVQSSLYSGLLVDAYQAANVSVKVSDLRAAVERSNPDGSVDVLVAVRVRVTNSQVADQEQGYRLRVQMAPADGTYKVAKLDQVTS